MKICIFGAGAVGCFLGHRLATAGFEVSAVARGATLAAIKKHGLRLVSNGGETGIKIRAVEDDPVNLGAQDLVVLSIKGTSLADCGAMIGPLIGPNTVVMTAMNGIPWWFFRHLNGRFRTTVISESDPSGRLSANIPERAVVGSVLYPNCETLGPGLSRHNFGETIVIGEPNSTTSNRIQKLASVFSSAGFDAKISSHIHRDIWEKLMGNLVMNPLSAVTGATCDNILDDPLLAQYCRAAMTEARTIGETIGITSLISVQRLIEQTRSMGRFRTSMLQDVDRHKKLEIDLLLSSVHEAGKSVGIRTPNIDSLLGIARLFAKVRGLY